jgi:hypothetical protein
MQQPMTPTEAGQMKTTYSKDRLTLTAAWLLAGWLCAVQYYLQ